MDEATASVDAVADENIQHMIVSCFGTATVLTIAHRLHTVAYYHRVLVLRQGHVAEYAPPLALLEKPGGSHFRSLANGSGDLHGLLRIARESEERRAKSSSM